VGLPGEDAQQELGWAERNMVAGGRMLQPMAEPGAHLRAGSRSGVEKVSPELIDVGRHNL